MLENYPTVGFKPASTILCYYTNSTNQIQIIRVKTNINETSLTLGDLPQEEGEANLHFEKVVFPHQQLLFEASPKSQLEIYISQEDNKMLAQLISCQVLEINKVPKHKPAMYA